jgi:hypothetical protein
VSAPGVRVSSIRGERALAFSSPGDSERISKVESISVDCHYFIPVVFTVCGCTIRCLNLRQREGKRISLRIDIDFHRSCIGILNIIVGLEVPCEGSTSGVVVGERNDVLFAG